MKAPEEKEEKRMERIARSEKKHRALADWLELVTEVMEIAVSSIHPRRDSRQSLLRESSRRLWCLPWIRRSVHKDICG